MSEEQSTVVVEVSDAIGGGGTTPSVSIIIPAYKIALFIGETLDSVFAQTFTGYEVIVVNDGSPDTEEFERALAPYAGRVRYFMQENLGAGAARNHGLREARGEYVAFLDGDDLWMPRYLEEQLKFIRGGGFDLVYTDALLFGDSPLAGKTYMETAPSRGPVTFLSLIRNECNVITSGVVARRQPVIEAGLFDEGLRNAQDFELWARLAKHGARLAYQRKVLLRYRYHEGSLSGGVLNRIGREWRVTKQIAETYELTPEERAAVEAMLEQQQATLELETGRLHLLDEKYVEARAAFEKAQRVLPGWKLRAALIVLRVAPRLLSKLARRRARV
ncbi:MAG: glycosyltransferase family 2 protein [Acidobacteria bacterium]|nr:glycosyltransferase family 2 protein [Acidobacteriota bacterium]